MADDPNRDILPVKDDSCYGSVRCSSEIDPRERHVVCKLDRYQLEDRYLRLLEEVQGLKKLSNSQEDKIKRLATKLMRSAASSRTCPAVLTINDERERIARLELENARLKDKAYTLKNQLLSHRGPRSPSRCRRIPSGVSSGPTTYRSESARTKYNQPPPRNGVDDNDAQNYLVKIEELETQRNEMMTRIADLEGQIAVHTAGIQREKVQENVEYIRMWRQMKQSNDKLISVQAANETLHSQIGDLKRLLEETTKSNRELTAALVSQKQRLSEVDEQLTSAKDSQLSLRENQEQIRDLSNEMKILQQHNSELISVSSKFGQIELENVELKRKVAECMQEKQSLKNAIQSEQASHAALRVTNDKLIKKLEELQKNMDNLTTQLVQNRGEGRRFLEKGTQTELKHADKNTWTSVASCSHSAPSDEEKETLSESGHDEHYADNSETRTLKFSKKGSSPGNTARKIVDVKNRPSAQSRPNSRPNSRTIYRRVDSKTKQPHRTQSPSMSREKMLKLLDQAQISTPLEAQNAARMRQIDVATGQNDASKYPEPYRRPEIPLSRSNDAVALTDVPSTPSDEEAQCHGQTESFDPKHILLSLFEILKCYSEIMCKTKCRNYTCDKLAVTCSTENCSSFKYQPEDTASEKSSERGHEGNRTGESLCEKLRDLYSKSQISEGRSNKERNLLHKFTETMCCTCDSNHRCCATTDCGYGCCTPEPEPCLALLERKHFSHCSNPMNGKLGRVGEIGLTIQETFKSMFMGRDSKCECDDECRDHWSEMNPGIGKNLQSSICKSPKAISDELEKRKELLHVQYNPSSVYKETSVSCCGSDCHPSNECGDTPVLCEISTFPMLITEGQGLVEIHILSLQLSTKGAQRIFKNDSENAAVFISWDIWGQETAFTPMSKYPSLSFNSSSVYRVCELQNFFDCVLREKIIFQVHLINRDEETFTIAKAQLSVKDMLDYPQNKLHYVTPVFSLMPCSCGANFGQLSLWVRLSCDIDLVERFKDRCGLAPAVSRNQIMQMRTNPRDNTHPELIASPVCDRQQETSQELPKDPMEQLTTVNNNRLNTIQEAELENQADPSQKFDKQTEYRSKNPEEKQPDAKSHNDDYSMSTNATNENDSQDSDTEANTSTYDRSPRDFRLASLQNKLDSSLQIESRSITEFNNVLKSQTAGSAVHGTESTSNDLGTVISDEKWQKYKRNSTRNSISFKVNSKDSSAENIQDTVVNKDAQASPEDTITITILSMNLFEKTSIMNDPEVQLLYVEYIFLGLRGADMETPSLPKPKNKGETMVYNFIKHFQVDEEYHNSQRLMLNAMLTGASNPIIRFVIVSEPLPEEMDRKECTEVGHADLNIREYALGDGLKNIPLIIMNPLQSEQIGMLKISIVGIEVIRDCMMLQTQL
ncbi:uncharacterized protein LOC124310258 [Neodiprion virginianus]|uniref:uncharacterized protein LOC124310258 n=1 Tax=Neodiprion virginianus TaxID=2961670 RepID=UPI001EE6BAC6|nr:uncharacterized protein LOC124310258 [Neodiprion virginianus]